MISPLVVRGAPENLNVGLPESGAECGGAHIGGAKLIRLDDYRHPLSAGELEIGRPPEYR
jgi:hypothetical protein